MKLISLSNSLKNNKELFDLIFSKIISGGGGFQRINEIALFFYNLCSSLKEIFKNEKGNYSTKLFSKRLENIFFK